MSDRPKLVVGLGNPGPEYADTRHNIGFAVIEALAVKRGGSLRSRTKFSAEVGEVGGVTLVKPLTFMNRSGVAVGALLSWLKLAPSDLLVVVDDADLPLGQVRLRLAGGSGGHNGLRSISEALGQTEQFARLRIGIGRRAPLGIDITNHVLGRFTTAERKDVDLTIANAVAAIECCLSEGFAVAMNRFNRRKGDAV